LSLRLRMSEKPEPDDFDDDDGLDGEAAHVDHLMRDMDAQKRRGKRTQTGEEPAWRRLERHLEKKRTADLVADFDDYDIGDDADESPKRSRGRGKLSAPDEP